MPVCGLSVMDSQGVCPAQIVGANVVDVRVGDYIEFDAKRGGPVVRTDHLDAAGDSPLRAGPAGPARRERSCADHEDRMGGFRDGNPRRSANHVGTGRAVDR